MEEDEINKKYWANEEPAKILAGHYFPKEELIDLLPAKSSVLDVGCGVGKISEYLYDNGYIVTGIDINKKALIENIKRNSNITYIEADVTKRLPFEDLFFDAIAVPYVFTSIIDEEKAQKAADELIRVLKTGGFLWFCEPTYSRDYDERYKIGKKTTGLDNVGFSLIKDGHNKGKIERFFRHYSSEDTDKLFKSLRKLSSKKIAVVSSHSGMQVQTIVTVYKKI